MKKFLILIFFVSLLIFPAKISAEEPLYIPYNLDQWFIDWRENELGNNPVDFCFIIDDSGSTTRSDPTKVRDIVVNQFIKNSMENDRFSIVQDNGQRTNLLVHDITQDKESIKNALINRQMGGPNKPAFSIDTCLNTLDTGDGIPNTKVIIHLGDGGFGYSYGPNADDVTIPNFIEENIINGIRDYGVMLYTIGFTNDELMYPVIEQSGSLKKIALLMGGKYYRLKIGEEAVPPIESEVNKCDSKEYAEANPGTCCDMYPETCCNNEEFINENWNSFTGEKEWYKTICCSQENFKTNNPNKCNVEVETPQCEGESDFCSCLLRLFIFLGHIMNIIKISVPIIIILLGSIDLIKALVAQNDDEIKKSKNIFIKRLIYAVVVFFVISIVSFLIGLAGGDTNNRCFKCVADVNGKACDKENIPVCCRK